MIPAPVLLAGMIIILFFFNNATLINAQTADTSKYGFEVWEMGWVAQDYVNAQGATDIRINRRIRRLGANSLEISLDLKGATAANPLRHPTHNAGEVYVNLLQSPPDNLDIQINGPINLEGKQIGCWVYVPQDVGASGEAHRPNGVQLFAKSVTRTNTGKEMWCSKYGSWNDLSGREGRWFPIFLRIDKNESYGGYMQSCFNPQRIVIIGVKFAIGDSSRTNYQGPAYIDAVDW
jgi:hypothetical protein